MGIKLLVYLVHDGYPDAGRGALPGAAYAKRYIEMLYTEFMFDQQCITGSLNYKTCQNSCSYQSKA